MSSLFHAQFVTPAAMSATEGKVFLDLLGWKVEKMGEEVEWIDGM